MTALLRIEGLQIEGRLPTEEWVSIVKGVDVEVRRGEVLALIGESGAGKSTIALACLGYTRPGCRIVGGRVMFKGINVLALEPEERREIRGKHVAYIAQSAAASFNSALTIRQQVTEGPLVHGLMTAQKANDRALDLYRRMRLPEPWHIGDKYPHQVSGGQLQRLMAVMAVSCGPELLVLDEPTTAIDVTTQVEVLGTLKDLIQQSGMAAIYVTHDLSVVAQMADRIVVLHAGKVVEQGDCNRILRNPSEDYTRALVAAVRPPPVLSNEARSETEQDREDVEQVVLEIANIEAGYVGRGIGNPTNQVLFDINTVLRHGEVVGIIGESGCGKSTLARVIAGLLPPSAGEICFHGTPLSPRISDRTTDEKRRIQIVFQMPDVSFNPRKRVRSALGRPLDFYFGMDANRRCERVTELLDMVSLPKRFADRYPAELSGGEKQRINLARAIAAEPDVILCDEVTAALDTIVAAGVIDLLKDLQKKLGNTYVFISHDLSTVASFADRIVVLYAGRVMEQGVSRNVLAPPYHPYTRLLISSVPRLSRGWLERVRGTRESITSNAFDVEIRAKGCPFFKRCPLAVERICDRVAPPIRSVSSGHTIACHREIPELLDLGSSAESASPFNSQV